MKPLEQWVHAYANAALRLRWLFFLAAFLLAVGTTLGIAKLQFKTDYSVWWADDAPEFLAFKALRERFGDDDTALIVFRDAEHGMLHNKPVSTIQRLVDQLWTVPGVKRVDSLTNFSSIRASRTSLESPALDVSATHIAAAGDRHEVVLFNRTTNDHRRLLRHTGLVDHLVFSKDGTTLFSAGVDRTILAWDTTSGEQNTAFRGLSNQVSAIAATDERIYGASFGRIMAWTTDGVRAWQHVDDGDYFTALTASPDGAELYAARKEIVVLDAATGKVLRSLDGHTGFVTGVILSADNATLVSAADDGRVLAWDTKTGKSRELLALEGKFPLSITWLSQESRIAVGVTDGTIRTVPATGGQAVVSRLHDDWVVDLAVAGDRVYSASRDKNIGVHVPGEGPVRTTIEVHRGAVRRVLVDGSDLISLGDDGDVYVIDRDTHEIRRRLARIATDTPPSTSSITGRPVGAIELYNGFRYPIDVDVGGRKVQRLRAGRTEIVTGLPVADPTPCEDDSGCATGQYCDYELAEPACAGQLGVRAFVAGTDVPVLGGAAFLVAGSTVAVRFPPDEPFGVTELATTPLDDRMRVGKLREAFPDASLERALKAHLGVDADFPETFVAPSLADELVTELRREEEPPKEALAFLSTASQVQMTALRLPIQPFRYRESAHHLARGPNAMALGSVLNDTFDTTIIAISLQMDPKVDALDQQLKIRHAIERIVDAEHQQSGYDFHMVGDVVQDTTAAEYAAADMERLLPLFFGVIAMLLLVLYRRLSGVLLPLGLVIGAIVMSMGAAGHLGAALDNLTVVVPQIVLASCIGDAVHLFTAFNESLRRGIDRRAAALEAVTSNFLPCLWTTVSTAIGFFSLSWSTIRPVATFGWMSGLGVVIAFICCFAVMPGIMVMLPVSKTKKTGPSRGDKFDDWVDSKLVDLARYVNRTSGTVVFIGLGVTGTLMFGLTKMSFDSNPLDFFGEQTDFRQAAGFIEDHISGPSILRLQLDAHEPGSIRKVSYEEDLAALRKYVDRDHAVVSVTALSDIIQEMSRVMNSDLDEQYRVPDRDRDVSSYYDAYSFSLRAGLELTNRVSADEGSSVMDVRFKNRSSSWMLAWGRDVLAWSKKNIDAGVVTVSGKNWLFANILEGIARGMFENVGSAVLLISIFMFILARRFGLGLLAALANIIPLLATVGLLSHSGTSLDLSIIVSCCVGIGVIVDDSIHFVSKYKKLRAAGHSHDIATEKTIRIVGRSMIMTTIVLVSGLAMFTLSDFQTNVNFGKTVAIMLSIGLAFDLTVLPASIKVFDRTVARTESEG